MKQVVKNLILTIPFLFMIGCAGPGEFMEPRTYGVPNSKWNNMSAEERQDRRHEYYQEQQLEMNRELIREQKEKNKLLEQQNKLIKEQMDIQKRGW